MRADRALEPANQGFDERAIRSMTAGMTINAGARCSPPQRKLSLPGTLVASIVCLLSLEFKGQVHERIGWNSCGVTDVEILRNEYDRLLGGPGVKDHHERAYVHIITHSCTN